jgi:hypothetical protein
MSRTNNTQGLLTLSEVGDILKFTSLPSVKKWLKSKNICINKFSKTSYVYEIEVVSEIQKPLAINLRRNYPVRWKEMFKAITPSEAVYNLVLIQLGEQAVYNPINMVKTKSVNDKKLLEELLKL